MMGYHTYKFEIKEDMETGIFGLVPEGSTGSIEAEPAVDGMLVAHDIMEHNFKGDDGSGHFEWMAMGFMLYIRVLGGYWGNFVEPISGGRDEMKLMAETFHGIHMFTMVRDNVYMMRPDTNMHTHARSNDHYVDEEIKEFEAYLLEILNDYEEEYHNDFTDDYRISKEEYVKRASYWVRKGYRKAVQKYQNRHGLAPFKTCDIFYEIQKTADKLIEWYAHADYVGKEIHIKVDLSYGGVTYEDEVYTEYYY